MPGHTVDGPTTGASLPVTGSIPVVRGALVAVVVTRGVTPWLPATLRALAAQTRPPQRVVVVDAAPGPGDTPHPLPADHPVADLARRTLDGVAPLLAVAVPGARTFGAAVRQAFTVPAVAAGKAGAADWLWLLHDDSAPEPDALGELVRAVEHAPSVGVAGAKQRSWDDPTLLLEVGLTTSRLGRRMTGVEDGEVDQGQHDGREDVLGVGLAGALVRRDVWDELGGPDPALGPFGDGLDLSRRARLAGHRVVVVPRAVVRHAQASYAGLREDDLRHVLTGSAPHDAADGTSHGPPRAVDTRRSYAARRRAQVHARLAAVPLPLLPLQTVAFLAVAVLRSLLRVAAKDGMLAAAELAAPVVAVLNPGRMARSRAAARRARRLPRRSLRALQSTWRDVYRVERDRALGRVEARRVVRAPSELELRELAALASRRRAGLAVLVAAVAGLTLAGLGRLVIGAVGGGTLVGGGLLPVGAGPAELWRAATLGWVPHGLGIPAPADPLLGVLAPFAGVLGGSGRAAVAVLLLGSPLVAGLGAWAAAGAATRSVAVRGWAAAVWVLVPAFAVAVDGGRLGAVVAHAALPWAALGAARALGVQRVDVVVPGLADARPAPGAHGATDARPAPGGHGATALVRGADPADVPVPHVLSAPAAGAAGQGSVTAAAAGGLALAVAVAGAPLLLPAGLLALALVAMTARRGRRRLVLLALPSLALAGPLVADALTRAGEGGWRVLLAEPGLAVDSVAAPAWQTLLGWPTSPLDGPGTGLPPVVETVLPFLLGGTLVLLAALALLRGPAVARGVRAGWAVAACGLAAAVVAGRVHTAVVDGAAVRGWTGAGVSLAALGLLTAAVLGADGARGRMARYARGPRQVLAGVLVGVAVLAPIAPLADRVLRATAAPPSGAGAPVVRTVDGPVVPAVGQQAQTGADRSRVLTLGVRETGEVGYGLLRGDGPQLTERSAAAAARALRGGPGGAEMAPDDPATTEVERLVARLATGAAADVSDDLGALAVGAVLVPPADDPADEAARAILVGRLDATAGLERITESPLGAIWRVVAPEPGPGSGVGTAGPDAAPGTVTAWARLVTPGTEGRPAVTVAVPAGPLSVRTTIPAGEVGRTVVLAERADPGWRAWLDGRPLRTVQAGWRQAFEVGADGGRLRVEYAPPGREVGLAAQAVALVLAALLALPVRRRRGGPR